MLIKLKPNKMEIQKDSFNNVEKNNIGNLLDLFEFHNEIEIVRFEDVITATGRSNVLYQLLLAILDDSAIELT